MIISNIAGYIDQTLLKPDALPSAIIQLCDEAAKYKFAAVCIHPVYVQLAKKQLGKSNVNICTVVGFPLGANVTQTKVNEALIAIDHGANEIDMVIQLGKLKAGLLAEVENDVQQVVKVCHEHQAICKVIIETAMLSYDDKINASKIVRLAGADYIKTSTGFGPGGATVDDVKLLAQQMQGTQIKVKASGGIRTRDEAEKMIESGAMRIGTSSGVMIVEGIK
jgi:deoxyribose-phosphate aldolase